MGFDIVTLTLVHVALSLLAIIAGLVVSGGFIAGRRLDGRVVATYVRGVQVYADGRFPNQQAGRLLRRGAA